MSDWHKISNIDGRVDLGDIVMVEADGEECEAIVVAINRVDNTTYVQFKERNNLKQIKKFFRENKVTSIKNTLDGFTLSITNDDGSFEVNIIKDDFKIKQL